MATRKVAPKDVGVEQLPLDLIVDLAPVEMERPSVFGDPLAHETSSSFPKPSAHIEIVDPNGELRLEDRKLYNVLLAVSWGPLAHQDHQDPGLFSAPALQLRRRIGQEGENSNRRIRDSMDRLMSTVVRFHKRMNDGQIGEAATTLLSYRNLLPKSGMVEWDFHPALRPYLARPSRWARLNLEICAKFRSKYALILYEHLSLRKELEWPIWKAGIDELRTFFCIPHDRYVFFSQFRQTVLEPALAEVNAFAKFRAEMEILHESGTGRPGMVRFMVLPERQAIEA